MVSEAGQPGKQAYDRWFLLGEKRNELLALWEVERYGRDNFGDPDYVAIYGLAPREWYARGVRILGRTGGECTRGRLERARRRRHRGIGLLSGGRPVRRLSQHAALGGQARGRTPGRRLRARRRGIRADPREPVRHGPGHRPAARQLRARTHGARRPGHGPADRLRRTPLGPRPRP